MKRAGTQVSAFFMHDFRLEPMADAALTHGQGDSAPKRCILALSQKWPNIRRRR